MSSSVLRVGIIGAGGISAAHLRSYRANGATIAAVADVDLARASARTAEFGGRAYADYVDMLEREDLDAVSICTPPAAHRGAALAALARGRPVLCEKPLARTVAEGREMVAVADSTGVVLMTALCHRFHGPVMRLKQLLEDGTLGQPLAFRNRFAGLFRDVQQTWFPRPEVSGGGVLLDNGVHSVDLFRYLCGEVTSVSAQTQTTLPEIAVEDTAAMVLTSASGVVGTVELSWATPVSENVVSVYARNGQGIVDYGANELRYRLAGETEWRHEAAQPPDRFALETAHFLECARTGARPRVDGRDGLRALEVIAEAYSSAGRQ